MPTGPTLRRLPASSDAAPRSPAPATGVFIRASGGSNATASELIEIFGRFVDAEYRADVAARAAEHGTGSVGIELARSPGQRRFDAFVTTCRAAASTPPGSKPPEPVLDVVVDQGTWQRHLAGRGLLPEPDDLAEVELLRRRCETIDGVPIEPDDAFQVAMRGWIRRVVMDSDGVITDFGRRQRLFPATLETAVRMMHRRCAHAGCSVPANRSEIDHLAGWARDHGTTRLRNSGPQCTAHSLAETRRGYRSQRRPGGRIVTIRPDGTLITPVGQRQHVAPPDARDDQPDQPADHHAIDHDDDVELRNGEP